VAASSLQVCWSSSRSHSHSQRCSFSTSQTETESTGASVGTGEEYEQDAGGRRPIQSYLESLVAKGEIQHDFHQFHAAQELDRLHRELMVFDPPEKKKATTTTTSEAAQPSSSLLFSFLASSSTNLFGSSQSQLPPPKGAYMYGGVGCGKTFLMNTFYESVDQGPWSTDKQKVHYHKFMLFVHQQMHEVRQSGIATTNNGATGGGDMLPLVIDRIIERGRLLCLDEFQVTDVADAMILQRIFEGLWNRGCILVATSNRPPQDLYLNGLQRDRFLPFIEQLEQKCDIVNMVDSEMDYLMMLSSSSSNNSQVYFAKTEKEAYKKIFYKFTQDAATSPTFLETQGRKVNIPFACISRGVARFTFEDLCQKALGAADYLIIGQNFHTVFCEGIPKMTINELNWLRRFITFVDTMYEQKVKLLLHTNTSSIDTIFHLENKQEYAQDEVFAFDRTRSRLEEMSSPKYLQQSQWVGKGTKAKDKAHVKTSLLLEPS
jgi:protein AFG1